MVMPGVTIRKVSENRGVLRVGVLVERMPGSGSEASKARPAVFAGDASWKGLQPQSPRSLHCRQAHAPVCVFRPLHVSRDVDAKVGIICLTKIYALFRLVVFEEFFLLDCLGFQPQQFCLLASRHYRHPLWS